MASAGPCTAGLLHTNTRGLRVQTLPANLPLNASRGTSVWFVPCFISLVLCLVSLVLPPGQWWVLAGRHDHVQGLDVADVDAVGDGLEAFAGGGWSYWSSASSLLALRRVKLGLQQLCFLAVHGHGGLWNVVLFTASGRGAKTGDEDTQKVKGDTMEDREMLSCSQLLVEEPRLEMKTHRRLNLKGTPWRTGKCCLVHSFW